MQTIICDTNIWYDIANNRINPKLLFDVQLIGTSVNITEISSSLNLINKFDLVARTVKAMYKYNSRVIISNPMEYLISLFYIDYEPNVITEQRLLEHFNTLMDIDFDEIPQTNINETKIQIEQIIHSGDSIADKINTDLVNIRQEIKQQIGKEKYRRKDFTKKWKKYFSKLVLEYSKQHCEKEYELDLNNTAWKYLEFFLITWESYFKNNLEIGNWKFDRNDWGDLFNLIYVIQGRKYWTLEQKWNRIFESNEKLKKYKFSTKTI